MTVPTYDTTWTQGADLEMRFQYLEGPDGSEVAVDLTGWKLRMDIKATDVFGSRVYTFNSDDIAATVNDEGVVDVVGNADNEAVLGTDGYINITIPRTLTLPGGEVYEFMQDGLTVFNYDVFLRRPTNKQFPVLKGSITVERSTTLWA